MLDYIDAKLLAWFAVAGLIILLRRFFPHLRDVKTGDIELIETTIDTLSEAKPPKAVLVRRMPFLAVPGRSRRAKDAAPPTTRRRGSQRGTNRPAMTVFVERAFDAQRRIGTWHAWIRYRGGAEKAGGLLPTHLHTADHAAVEAIVCGVGEALKLLPPGGGAAVLVQTSSEHAIDVLSGRVQLRENRMDERAAIDRLNAAASAAGVTLRFRHLHDPGGSAKARKAASTMCDQAAREALEQTLRSLSTTHPEV